MSRRASFARRASWHAYRRVIMYYVKVKSFFFSILCRCMGMQIGKGVEFKGCPRIRAGDYRRVIIKDRAIFEHDVLIWQNGEANLVIGENSYIGQGTILNANTENGGITIGKDVMIGAYSLIQDNDHGIEPGIPMRKQRFIAEPIIIEDDVWIGAHVSVLKGVTIRSGAVIGANSTVTKPIEGNAIAVGSPAKVRRIR